MFQTSDLDMLVDEYDELLLLMDMFEIGISNERLEKLKERKQKVIDQFHLLITESKRTLRNTHILFKSNQLHQIKKSETINKSLKSLYFPTLIL